MLQCSGWDSDHVKAQGFSRYYAQQLVGALRQESKRQQEPRYQSSTMGLDW